MALSKTKKYKMLACCGCGNGTCQMLAMKLKNVNRKLGIVASVEPAPASVGMSQGMNYDVVICSMNLVDKFQDAANAGTHVIGMKNVMSEKEIEEKLVAAFED